jgi:TonB-linked SusC/RagA family outer membrane protein
MKRIFSLWLLGLLLAISQVYGQGRTISGTVTDATTGDPLIGVNVMVKGTTMGTATDMDGNYSLQVPDANAVLEFSYVGFVTLERQANANVINISLSEDAAMLEEVVVTALGLTKDEKKLSYGVTQVDGSVLQKVPNYSAVDALSGKVAGVNIGTSSGSPGASTKIVIRGNSSITGTNQPLIVIDGVPVNNSFSGNTGNDGSLNGNRSFDLGNQLNNIDPDDIESVTLLKGSSASALYGADAGRGVLIINTKSGSKNKKVGVDMSYSYTLQSVGMLPESQSKFGQGWSGTFAYEENGSWGPKLDGTDRLWGNQIGSAQQIKPFKYQENKIRDFFDLGYNSDYSMAIYGGNENVTYRVGYSNVFADGIVPLSGDKLNRNTLNSKINIVQGKFKAGVTFNYVNRLQNAVATGQGDDAGEGPILMTELYQIPVDHSIIDSRDYLGQFYNRDNYFTPYAVNPYYPLNESGTELKENRVYGNVELGYEPVKNLNLLWRVGGDMSSIGVTSWGNKSILTPGSPNGGGGVSTANNIFGAFQKQDRNFRQVNSDVIVTYAKEINKYFEFDVLGGYNVNGKNSTSHTSRITNLTIPGFYTLTNSGEIPVVRNTLVQERKVGLYGQLNVGIVKAVYLSGSYRQDWLSNLPEENRSVGYFGTSASVLLSELIDAMPKQLQKIKIYGSYSSTGFGAPDAYLIKPVFTSAISSTNGYGSISFPFSGINGYEVGNRLGSSSLVPQRTFEGELGVEWLSFDSRVGVNYNFYNKLVKEQVFDVDLAPSSGYTVQVTNIGSIQNRGHELSVNVIPVKTSKFSWEINYRFTKNNSLVKELLGEGKRVLINSLYDVEMYAEEGKPLGTLYGPVEKRDSLGRIIVNESTGLPKISDELGYYGDVNNKFQMGFTNTLSWNGLSFSFDLDYRKGGKMYSYTARINNLTGNGYGTTYNDRNTFIIPNSVTEEEVDGQTVYSENIHPVEYQNYWSYYTDNGNKASQQLHVIDRSYLKLRELVLAYSLPTDIVKKFKCQSLTFSFAGRNLFVWTPKQNFWVDPESTSFGTGLDSYMGEFASLPMTRNYSFAIKASF